MDAPHVAELILGVGQEAVVTAVEWVPVVGWASVDHASVVVVLGDEGVGELVEVESAVTSAVVAGHEELNFLGSWENSNGREAVSEVGDSDLTTVVAIEDLEGVSEVKVTLKGQAGLVGLDLALKGDNLAETLDESVLLWVLKDWLSGWRQSSWRATGWGALSQRGGRVSSW